MLVGAPYATIDGNGFEGAAYVFGGGGASWQQDQKLVASDGDANGYSTLPGFSLVLGFIGAGAVIAFAVFLSKFSISTPIRYCGENSIVIYLSFFLFMAATRTILLKTGVIATYIGGKEVYRAKVTP